MRSRRPTFGLTESDIDQEPLVAVAVNLIGADGGGDAARHPIGASAAALRLLDVIGIPTTLRRQSYHSPHCLASLPRSGRFALFAEPPYKSTRLGSRTEAGQRYAPTRSPRPTLWRY